MCYTEKTHNKIKSDQHDTWRGLNWKTTKWPRSHRPGKEWIAPNKVARYNNDWIQKARIKKWKWRKTSQLQLRPRPAQGTSEETRKTKDPELPDGLESPNFVMNCQRRAMVIVQQNMTGYDCSWRMRRSRENRWPCTSKRWSTSTKVGLMSPGACHIFPPYWSRFHCRSVVQIPRNPMTSEVRIQTNLLQQ